MDPGIPKDLYINRFSAIEFITIILFAYRVKRAPDRRHESSDERNANKPKRVRLVHSIQSTMDNERRSSCHHAQVCRQGGGGGAFKGFF